MAFKLIGRVRELSRLGDTYTHWGAQAQEYYDDLWKAFVRPPRDTYSPAEFGETSFKLEDSRPYMRTDFQVLNERGQKIVCSHFEPHPSVRPADKLPCVIYLHGNCSSRVESLSSLPYLLPLNITVVGFDFTGSGHSDGEYVTLGWNERHDLREVIDYLREKRNVSLVALWGRSMGAVTAILHSNSDATISGMVCDSPFGNLRKLAEELADEYIPSMTPRFVVAGVLNMVRLLELWCYILLQLNSTIRTKAGFDMNDMDIVAVARETYVPGNQMQRLWARAAVALYITGTSDQFVKKHHAEKLYQVHAGEKWLIEVDGDHNSARSETIMNSISIFFYNTLHCDMLLESVPLKAQAYWLQLSERAAEVSVFPSCRISSEGQTKYIEAQAPPISPTNEFMMASNIQNLVITDIQSFKSDDSLVEHEARGLARAGIRMQPPERACLPTLDDRQTSDDLGGLTSEVPPRNRKL